MNEQVAPREASGSGEVRRAKLLALVKAVHVVLCSGEDGNEEKEQDRRHHDTRTRRSTGARPWTARSPDDHREQSDGDHAPSHQGNHG